MKGIIVAAGPSSRLRPLTEYLPKTLLEVDGKTILDRIVESLNAGGVNNIAIITGYQMERFTSTKFTYFNNPDFYQTNILTSLFCAEEFMEGGFVFSYSDILYSKTLVQKLMDSPHDISLVVDTAWERRYEGRTDHPTDEAEIACVSDGKITRLSKFFNPEAAYGEFIGLAKFSAKGAEILRRNYHRALKSKWCGYDGRFHDAKSMEKAYLTDMIQELIMRGYPIHSVDIQGKWVEMDTEQDFEYAKSMIKKGLL